MTTEPRLRRGLALLAAPLGLLLCITATSALGRQDCPAPCPVTSCGAGFANAVTGWDPVMMQSWVTQNWSVIFSCAESCCPAVSACGVCYRVSGAYYDDSVSPAVWRINSNAGSTGTGNCGTQNNSQPYTTTWSGPPGVTLYIHSKYDQVGSPACAGDWLDVSVAHASWIDTAGPPPCCPP